MGTVRKQLLYRVHLVVTIGKCSCVAADDAPQIVGLKNFRVCAKTKDPCCNLIEAVHVDFELK